MSTADSPAVARRRVRLALREAREAAGLTQTQVADAMEWSLSKVMRIESGEVSIALNDLKAVLPYVQITDPETVTSLIQDARVAKQRRTMWWDEPAFREHLTPAMRQLFQYEADAVAIRHFDASIVPARFQIPAYAKALIDGYALELPAQTRAARLDTRMRRRDALLKQRTPPELLILLDQAVLLRQTAGKAVLLDQLVELASRAKAPRTTVRIMPFTFAGPLPMYGAYEIIDLDRSGEDSVLYREGHLSDEIVDDQALVKEHRQIFEEVWSASLDDDASARLIADRIEELRS
jgi:transcriptional regulator with XRE-family HTH domain